MSFFTGLMASVVILGGEYSDSAQAGPIVPRVDHHQHLQSPERARIANGPETRPAITVPQGVADLLTARADRWNDAEKLSELYLNDSLVLVNANIKTGFTATPGGSALYLSTRFGRPYRLTPVSFRQDGSLASVVGYYTIGSETQPRHIGFFQLTLVRQSDDRWRIASEVPSFRTEPEEVPILARDMVAMLDAAGIERAVVLSAGYGMGSRSDLDGVGETTEVRHRRVQAENDWTAAQVAEFPQRLIAFCGFSPIESFALAELERCAASGAFRGVKFTFDESRVDLANTQHVESLRAVFAAANRHRLPLVVHVGNNRGTADQNRAAVTTLLDLVATAAPDVTVQVAHLWGGQGFSPTALDAYATAMEQKRPGTERLYFDMSEAAMIASQYGAQSEGNLKSVADGIRRIGVDRVLFGSDTARKFGHLPPKEAWEQFMAVTPLTQDEFRTIAQNTAPYLRTP